MNAGPQILTRVAAAVLLGAAAAFAKDPVAEELPREVPLETLLSTRFDMAWILPETRSIPGVEAAKQPVNIVKRAKALATMKFAPPAGTAPGAAPERLTRSFGDLVAAVIAFGNDVKACDAWLSALQTNRPEIWKECGAELAQLTRAEFLLGPKWDPEKDDDRDAIFTGRAFRADCEGTAPWSKIDGDPMAQQAIGLILADLETIKEVENDYSLYPSNVGANYMFIHGTAGSFCSATDASGRPINALGMQFRQDLPFPYSHYDCDLRILNRLDDDGHLVTDIYSPSKDFDWMAGQDVFVPILDGDGGFVGILCARVFGFDLDGVPDGEEDVRVALRASLGNLKRRADKAFAEHVAKGGKPRTLKGAIPAFTLRGTK